MDIKHGIGFPSSSNYDDGYNENHPNLVATNTNQDSNDKQFRVNPTYEHEELNEEYPNNYGWKSNSQGPANHYVNQPTNLQINIRNGNIEPIIRPPTTAMLTNDFHIHATAPPYYTGNNISNYDYINKLHEIDTEQLQFTNESIRMGFIRKVFSLLIIQLLVTSGIIGFMVFQKDVKIWMSDNLVFFAGSLVAAIILTIIIYWSDKARRKSPLNLILLSLLTILYGLAAGSISAYQDTDAVVYAAGFTIAICLSLVLFSFQSKWNFNMTSGSLLMTIVFIIIAAVLSALLFWFEIIDKEYLSSLILAFVGALILSFALVWTLKNILNETCSLKITSEEYVLAALILYTHIILIFLVVLYLYSAGSRGGGNCGGNTGCCVGTVYGRGYYGHNTCCCCWGASAVAVDETIREREQNQNDVDVL